MMAINQDLVVSTSQNDDAPKPTMGMNENFKSCDKSLAS